jgi:Putative Actinobacterial Holin-X, holin superfamily III
MVTSEQGDSIRVQSVPTRDLVSGIVSKATLLARKEVELVKAEIKADLQTHISMVKSLAIAALFAVVGLSVLLVAAVFALAPYVAPWLAALVLGGALVAAGVVLGYIGWARRVVNPLALTRKTLREDLQWAKEHLA